MLIAVPLVSFLGLFLCLFLWLPPPVGSNYYRWGGFSSTSVDQIPRHRSDRRYDLSESLFQRLKLGSAPLASDCGMGSASS